MDFAFFFGDDSQSTVTFARWEGTAARRKGVELHGDKILLKLYRSVRIAHELKNIGE